MAQILDVSSWPQAILHVDADAFFASCEQAMHPELAGKPVITGKERGIVAAASYEAKARGVTRGMRLHEVLRVCSDAVILPSDYETYSLYSVRMFDILRRYSPTVEEYSIDEAFADLTGLRRPLNGSYSDIAKRIQGDVKQELGLGVSVGISLSKVLAKLASKHHKPAGFTVVPGRKLHLFLGHKDVGSIWGIGANTEAYCQKLGIRSAYDFACKDERFINSHFSKPYRELWHELNGRSVLAVDTQPHTVYKTISKTKTFTPPSADESFIFAQLVRNLENACAKARRHGLVALELVIYMRTQDFQDAAVEIRLSRATNFETDLTFPLREGFKRIYKPNTLYRGSGVVLARLKSVSTTQLNLFDDPMRIERITQLCAAVDQANKRFGKHTVSLGATLPTILQAQHEGERGDAPWRKSALVSGENARQRLGLPALDVKV